MGRAFRTGRLRSRTEWPGGLGKVQSLVRTLDDAVLDRFLAF
jgi:hypothetical protein